MQQWWEPTGNDHGPVRVDNTHYLEYADRTPIYAVGTTSYQWTSVNQSIQDKTVETLVKSPLFKKIMEEASVTEMTPRLVKLSSRPVPEDSPDRIDRKIIDDLNNNIYVLSKDGENYLATRRTWGERSNWNLPTTKNMHWRSSTLGT